MNRLTSIPASCSVFTIGRTWTLLSTTSSPPSVVISSRRSGTSVTWSGLAVSARWVISCVVAISRLRRVPTIWRSTCDVAVVDVAAVAAQVHGDAVGPAHLGQHGGVHGVRLLGRAAPGARSPRGRC